jgi:hypothetical protein
MSAGTGPIELAAARLALDLIQSEQLVAAAASALDLGQDSPSLRVLAGLGIDGIPDARAMSACRNSTHSFTPPANGMNGPTIAGFSEGACSPPHTTWYKHGLEIEDDFRTFVRGYDRLDDEGGRQRLRASVQT